MPPSRRDVLTHLLGAAALPLLPACHDDSLSPASPAPAPATPSPAPAPTPAPAPSPSPVPPPAASNNTVFAHGVASGDPLADKVVLWTRLTVPATTTSANVAWRLYADAALTQLVREGMASTGSVRDFTVKVDADGLLPGRSYYYRFEAMTGATGLSPVGRTRTLPASGAQHLRVALVTCSNNGSVMNAYARVAERADLDLVLHLGDYAYCDTDYTLDQYRSRHKTYKTDNAELRELHRQHPMIVIWDDHETCNDAYETGAPAPNAAIGPLWTQRRAAATQAFFEHLPIRDNADGSRRIYRRFALGGLVDLFMLDGRLEGRSVQVSGETDAARSDPARTMLGQVQEDWLYDGLRGSSASWKLIGNQTMLGHLNEVTATGAATNNWMDQWDGYPPARQRLYEVLKGDATHAKVGNVVVCTGDWHNSFIMDLPEDPATTYAGGSGSLAVEYVTPSITSGFFGVSDLAPHSPHIKHHNDAAHGYQLLDIKPDRVIGEEWQVDTVAAVSMVQTLAVAFETSSGSNRLKPYTMGATTAKPDAPALAPPG